MNCPIKLGKDKNEIENLLVNFHLFLKLSKLSFQFSVVFNLFWLVMNIFSYTFQMH